MAGVGDAIGGAKGRARQAVDNPVTGWLVRLGYIVRGVLYGLIGLLALQLALGRGGESTDKNGAIAQIAGQPFGRYLLIIIVVGLAGYSLWGFIRAILDPLHRGTDPKGLAQRTGYVVSGVTYGSLIYPTLRTVMGAGGTSGAGGNQDWSAGLLAQPYGPWLLGLIGVVATVGGLGQIWQGVKAGFKKDFKLGEMSRQERDLAIRSGQVGMSARGVVFAMLGFFLIQAALHHDPKEAKGLDGALATLLHEPYGPYLLGLVAVGLVLFGVFSILSGKWIKLGIRG